MILCSRCKQVEVKQEQNICYNCYKTINNFREIASNEIVLDNDNQKYGELAIRQVCLHMSLKGYKIEIWNHKGKSYHAHIKDIPLIDKLSKEQNQFYKELIIKRYIEETKKIIGEQLYLNDFDFSVCRYNHLIAEENKLHYRTKKVKKLIAVVNEELVNFLEKDIYNEVSQETKQYNPNIIGTGITAEIIKKISIIELAKRFGIKVDSNGMAECPFHNDTNPSLKFYESQGRFVCFGCNLKGNIIDFYALCKLNLKEKI